MRQVLLASQEAAARAATRDQHLRRNAHPPVAETASTIQVLARQRPLKNGPGAIRCVTRVIENAIPCITSRSYLGALGPRARRSRELSS